MIKNATNINRNCAIAVRVCTGKWRHTWPVLKPHLRPQHHFRSYAIPEIQSKATLEVCTLAYEGPDALHQTNKNELFNW